MHTDTSGICRRPRALRALRALSALQLVLFCSLPAAAQDASVRPGINDSFVAPDVSEFVERFEKEGREVFDHREKIVAACNLEAGMVVADIGAGTGLFTRLMAPLVGNRGRVLAVDIAEEFVHHVEQSCRQQGIKNVMGVVCQPDSVALAVESIDLAFICDAYHHFEFPYKTMRSLYRALKPAGEVVLVDFHRIPGESSDWILGHVRGDQETFLREIRLSGFEVVEEHDFLETSYCVRLQKSPRRTERGHTTDTLDDVEKLLGNGTATLVDVREQEEWDAGHLAAATLLPLSTLAEYARGPRTSIDLDLPTDKIIYLHCRSGQRVLVVDDLLSRLGYDIRPLEQGYDELRAAGFAAAE